MKRIFAALCALLLVPTMALCDEIESIRNVVQSGLYDTEKINYIVYAACTKKSMLCLDDLRQLAGVKKQDWKIPK